MVAAKLVRPEPPRGKSTNHFRSSVTLRFGSASAISDGDPFVSGGAVAGGLDSVSASLPASASLPPPNMPRYNKYTAQATPIQTSTTSMVLRHPRFFAGVVDVRAGKSVLIGLS
jgi:hypothetical protein